MFYKPLWMEFNLGGYKHGSPISMLALLYRPIYICDVWKVGLGLNPDENGIVTRHEINTKIKALLSDDVIKTKALELKEMAKKSVGEGGSSFKNFESFIEQMKH
ncbi:hypothetical protein ACB092_04G129400 [Castanea dentata]